MKQFSFRFEVQITSALLLIAPAHAQVFSDQAAAVGIIFTNNSPIDVLHLGAGGGWGDYDGDGSLDIYLCARVGPNALFENQGDGSSFIDRAAELGVDCSTTEGTGVLFGDYDNDGDSDLYVLNRGDNIMFRNDGSDGLGGWIFVDVTAELGVEGAGRSSGAAYGDVDGDGYLDLYVSCHNESLLSPQPNDARRDYLYHNVTGPLGGRLFEDWSSFCDLDEFQEAAAHSVAFLDIDGDLDLDIFVVNEDLSGPAPPVTGENFMWRNDGPNGIGGWNFSNVAAAAGLGLRNAPMGIAVGDYNNDGAFDIATSDAGPNHLYQKQAPGVFADVAVAAGVDRPMVPSGLLQISWGMSFVDWDLDGFEDLYVAAGRLPSSLGQPNALFQNDGNPPNNTFTDISLTSGADVETSSRTVVKGDYDNDGDQDILINTLGGDAYLFRNDQVGGSYFAVDLEGVVSNRDAIGAIIRITSNTPGAPVQWRLVQSGSSTGGCQALRQTFGVTGATHVIEARVFWPSGRVSSRTDLPINEVISFLEPCTASNANYGPGTEGSAGFPSLTASGVPVMGTTISLPVSNSSGATTTGILLVGLDRDFEFFASAKVLVYPFLVKLLSLPAAGLSLTFNVPTDPSFCGLRLDLQILEVDDGAIGGFSASDGLELYIGL